MGADDESREDRAIAELQMNVHRENGERDADGQVTNEGEGDGGKNSCNHAAGKFAGAQNGGDFGKRSGGGGDGVRHRSESNPQYKVR